MKLCLLLLNLFVVYSLYGQEKKGITYSRVIVDSNYACMPMPFGFTQSTRMFIPQFKPIADSDITSFITSREKFHNCRVFDTADLFEGFDNCLAFKYNLDDTLLLLFQNDEYDDPVLATWDKLLFHIFGHEFYVEYVYTSRSRRLDIIEQQLIVKKLSTKKGDHLCGELTLRCIDTDNAKNETHLVTFKGKFNAIIE